MSIYDKMLLEISKDINSYAYSIDLEQFESIIRYANDRYHNTSEPILDDIVYDKLVEIFESRYIGQYGHKPEFLSTSGAVPNTGKLVKLPFYMSGLDKYYTRDFPKLLKDITSPYLITAKIDGASMLYYNNVLYSRGRNDLAQDISFLIPFLKLPKIPGDIGVRGELMIYNQDFKEVFIPLGYHVPRNAVAGIINSDNVIDIRTQYLHFITYEIISLDTIQSRPSEQLNQLKTMGFETVISESTSELKLSGLTELLNQYRTTLPFEIDGLVVSSDLPYRRCTFGFPKNQKAFKMNSDGVETTVKDIFWEIGRIKRFTPVIIIEPVTIKGSVINRVSGHNARWLIERKIGKNAVITVTKAGDVIPYIDMVVKESNVLEIPKGAKWDETETNLVLDDQTDHTDDTIMDDLEIKKLHFFLVSIGAKNIGENRVKELYQAGHKTILQLITMTSEEISFIGPTLSVSICDSITNAIYKSTLPDLMACSGFFGTGIGIKRLKTIYQTYPDLLDEAFLPEKDLIKKISSINGFAEITSTMVARGLPEFHKFFNTFPEKVKTSIINNTIQQYNKEELSISNTNPLLSGKKILVTGFRNDDLIKKITEQGGHIQSSINKDTDILIIKNSSIQNIKTTFAQMNNITIVTFDDFIKKYLTHPVVPIIPVVPVVPVMQVVHVVPNPIPSNKKFQIKLKNFSTGSVTSNSKKD